jgi:hypothetical protein
MFGTEIKPLRGFPYLCGEAGRKKPLHEFILTIPKEVLSKFGMLVTEPLDIRNTVAQYLHYATDAQVHNVPEYWPFDLEDFEKMLLDPREDCDGMAIFAASWLHTLGNTGVRICLGGYNEKFINHMWTIIVSEDESSVKLLETTGDDLIEELPELADHPEYYLMYSASAFHKKVYKHV